MALGGGEVPGLVFGVLRPRPSAESFTAYNRECEVNLLNVHIRGWNTDEKNNVRICIDAMEPGDATSSELNTSDSSLSASM